MPQPTKQTVHPAIFKAYDVRGKVGTELTAGSALAIGQAFGSWLGDGTVAVGRDMRPDSEELATSLIEGLRLQGRDVIDIGLVSSDMIYFAVGNLGLAGGAMVTASHNPGAYNGIKLCRDQAQAIGIETGLAEIRDVAVKNQFSLSQKKGDLSSKDIGDAWIEHVLSFVDAKNWPAYKIAIDAGNGMLGAIAPLLEKQIPQVKITPMFYELDGTFPNHPANPLLPEGVADLQKKVLEKQLDFGIAFDGDGDRAVLVDETGRSISGGQMSSILSAYFLEKFPGATIVYDARNSRAVPELVENIGGVSVRSKVGHSFIKALMRRHDAVFGGEASGHYYFKDNWYADSGLIAAVVTIQVLTESGLALSELVDQYQSYYSINETNFEVHDKQKTLDALKIKYSDCEQDELDGLTVEAGDEAWFNVRASNTEPLLRLNAEAKSQQKLDELVDKVISIIKN